jgi:formate hydrogenlyase subunit 4
MNGILIEILQVAVLVGLSPALVGWLVTLKCWLQGRTSPGLLQPYRNLRKLFAKDVVLARNASWIFRFSPYLIFGTAVLAGGIVPILSLDLPLALTADAIVLVMLFALARFFTALAGMDIGTAFGGMGSSREMMVASLAEPAMLMAIFTVSLLSGSTSLIRIAEVVAGMGVSLKPSIVFAFIAFVMIVLAENGRIPIDNPTTHLELTMLHEAMVLEYSGRHLALIEWAGMMKLFLFLALGNIFFFPFGIARSTDPFAIAMAGVALVAKLLVSGSLIVLIETMLAKMRLFRVTEYLSGAFLIGTLGMLSFFILE